jgi:fructose-specific phosphotransferase system IIC component
MQTVVKHEQIKLVANALSNLGCGAILTSVIAPYIGIATGTLTPTVGVLNLATACALGVVLGAICIVEANRRLSGLEAIE